LVSSKGIPILNFRLPSFRQPVNAKKERNMDNVTLIRVVAGVLALVVLGVIIWRRKRQSID